MADVDQLLIMQLTIRRLRLEFAFTVMLSRDPYVAFEDSGYKTKLTGRTLQDIRIDRYVPMHRPALPAWNVLQRDRWVVGFQRGER